MNTAGALMSANIKNFPDSLDAESQVNELLKAPLVVNKDVLTFYRVPEDEEKIDQNLIFLKSRTNSLLGGAVLLSCPQHDITICLGVVNDRYFGEAAKHLFTLYELLFKTEIDINPKTREELSYEKLKSVSEIIQTLKDFDSRKLKPEYKRSRLFPFYTVPELAVKRPNFGISNERCQGNWNLTPRVQSADVHYRVLTERVIEFLDNSVVWEVQQRVPPPEDPTEEVVPRVIKNLELQYLQRRQKIGNQKYVFVLFVHQQHPHFEYLCQQIFALMSQFPNYLIFTCILEVTERNLGSVISRADYVQKLNLIDDDSRVCFEELKVVPPASEILTKTAGKNCKLHMFKGYLFDRNKIEKYRESVIKQQQQEEELGIQPLKQSKINQDPVMYCDDFVSIQEQMAKMSQRPVEEPLFAEFDGERVIFRGVRYPYIFDNQYKHQNKIKVTTYMLVLADLDFQQIAKELRTVVDLLDKKPHIDATLCIRNLNLKQTDVMRKFKFVNTKKLIPDEKAIFAQIDTCYAIAIRDGKQIIKDQNAGLLDWFMHLDTHFEQSANVLSVEQQQQAQ